jgi:hypothetical protein
MSEAPALVVRLVCGCSIPWGSGEADAPYCQSHNERRVSRVTAPPPSFIAVDCDLKSPLMRSL